MRTCRSSRSMRLRRRPPTHRNPPGSLSLAAAAHMRRRTAPALAVLGLLVVGCGGLTTRAAVVERAYNLVECSNANIGTVSQQGSSDNVEDYSRARRLPGLVRAVVVYCPDAIAARLLWMTFRSPAQVHTATLALESLARGQLCHASTELFDAVTDYPQWGARQFCHAAGATAPE